MNEFIDLLLSELINRGTDLKTAFNKIAEMILSRCDFEALKEDLEELAEKIIKNDISNKWSRDRESLMSELKKNEDAYYSKKDVLKELDKSYAPMMTKYGEYVYRDERWQWYMGGLYTWMYKSE